MNSSPTTRSTALHRRTKPSIVLGAVALLAVASPFAAYSISGDSASTDVRSANETTPVTVPTKIVETALAAAPDIVIPLRELTGLPLPDLRLSDLKYLPLPDNIAIPPFQIPEIPGLTVPDSSIPSAQAPVPLAPSDVSAPVTPPAGDDPGAPLGAVVKELKQDTPFSMVALTSTGLDNASAQIRRQLDDGSWGPWLATEPVDTGVDDAATAPEKQGTEPIFVGATKAVQLLMTPRPQAPAPVPAPAPAPAPEMAPAPEQPLGYTPASVSKPLRQQDTPLASAIDGISAVLIQPGTSPADATLSDLATPVAGSTGPKVISRSQWGADESIRCATPDYDDFLGGATVHHTAGSNEYSKSESVEIVRAIYAYHAQTLGWCDVGYNVLVDKYGQIFEGRAGGLDKPVQGAHAGGFNENTMGIAMMGDFSTEAPPQATIDSVGSFLGWRLGLAGLDPKGSTTMTSEGTEFTFVGQGQSVDLPVIFAHRDVGNTACPGDGAYAKLDEIRDIAEASLGGAEVSSAPAETDPAEPALEAAAPEAQTPNSAGTDVSSTLGAGVPALVDELLRLADQNPIAQKWLASGGETGILGSPVSGLVQVKGGQSAGFANGSIFTTIAGQAVAVIGKIFEQFLALGGENGDLGLPSTDEYRVPEGLRTDFENGSLIFNEATGIVTTVIKTYNDTYQQKMDEGAVSAPIEPAPAAPEVAPAP
ncbi:N-acetylmuramoyl-L-alanine amidase [Rhodococcus sp. H36-A4]|uniref:N-acetylmuramoyl-L-alanine amidase n=1 Tax=Rhodococcus sp. H36-A4 TaxID=3004353 RepID=UPI0022AF4DFA|nr:N-acetylmuramoyl-L-alanine amidase [Rhodococcus sp. H36-A4]MCZ4077338.1 N-acetylmuramoyl-L-alanine amidase [Rhodococcus sp. H36-A4]